MKWKYPVPRSNKANLKDGPCGDGFTNDYTGEITTFIPGEIVTLHVIETIHHIGSPYRIALSYTNNDIFDDCIILDHIPQHNYGDVRQFKFNITIPDVQCTPCALQIISFMTDKILDNTCCQYNNNGRTGTCFSNYHSCANIYIDGTTPINQYNCSSIYPEWKRNNWGFQTYTQESSSNMWHIMDDTTTPITIGLDTAITDNEADPCQTSPTSVNETRNPSISPVILQPSHSVQHFSINIFIVVLCFILIL